MALDIDLRPDLGDELYQWARDLYPIPRSLTNDVMRHTLGYLTELMPDLAIHEVPSGTEAFDWQVPDEWNVDEAYIIDPDGRRICDFDDHNLHLMGYSVPVDAEMTLDELQPHLHSIPEQPDAIPYVTSYYRRRWGFCLSHRQRNALKPGTYRVVIRSRLEPGHMTYGQLILPGQSTKEVLFSTYICHPSMANNELSGPVVATALARWLASGDRRRLTYRFVFAPETIGSIYYISRHLRDLRQHTIAGFQLTCCGDERTVSFMPSRRGDTLADRVARHVLGNHTEAYEPYSFLDRGSDERQYCSPGVDLPVVSIMRSKYREYPEYHTSLDDLSLISPAGLAQTLELHQKCVTILENNFYPVGRYPCEPQLGKRGLYPTLSKRNSGQTVRTTKNLLAYADGERDLIDIAELIGVDCLALLETAQTLKDKGVIVDADEP
jgi:aminopeptidase-like protein